MRTTSESKRPQIADDFKNDNNLKMRTTLKMKITSGMKKTLE